MPSRPKEDSRHPPDSFKNQHENWRRAYADAMPMQERFPGVEQLVLDMTFVDPSRIGIYSPRMHGFSAAAKAFFAIPCPRTLCLDGGFDLDAVVHKMLAAGEVELNGILECHGWLDPARPDHARCKLQMHYRLQARFESPEAGAAGGRRLRASKT